MPSERTVACGCLAGQSGPGRQLGADLQVPAPGPGTTELTIEATTEISQDSADQHMFRVTAPGPRPRRGATCGVVLAGSQWALEDAAHDWPTGRATPQQREELAGILDALAAIVRASIPGAAITDPQS